MSLEFAPLPGGIGLEVKGLDLDGPVKAADAQALNEAWLDRGILVFRAIGTSSERQLALSRCFGELEVHPLKDIHVEGYPAVTPGK